MKLIKERTKTGETIFACGFSPSGFMHLGTLREVILSVYLSFQYGLVYEEKCRVYLFIDDHDPLTKIPENWPIPEEALGMKLCLIPNKYSVFLEI